MTRKASAYLLTRARICPAGTCVLCGPRWHEESTWEPGTGERLCSDHSDTELAQARAALLLADQSRNGAEP